MTTNKPPKEPSWEDDLMYSEHGNLLGNYSNLVTILRDKPWWRDPDLHPLSKYRGKGGSRLCFNEMTRSVHILLEPLGDDGKHVRGTYVRHVLDEEWFAWVRDTLARTHQINPDKGVLIDAVRDVSYWHKFHPIRDYLQSLTWDGLPRLDLVAKEVLRIEKPTALERRTVALWMISAVARVMDPGCKVDTVLVLKGDQGLRKSTFFEVLAGEWFSDSPMEISNKDCFLQMNQSWIYEWGEIGKLTRKHNAEVIKAFITSREDLYRAPYGREAEKHPRSMVFVGTTNEDEFLTDDDNRRFWILLLTKAINIDLLREWRDQLWAEAVAAYNENPVDGWVLTSAEETERRVSSEIFQTQDVWYPTVKAYVDGKASEGKAYVVFREIMNHLGFETKDMKRPEQERIRAILRELKYGPAKDGHDNRRVWKRKV